MSSRRSSSEKPATRLWIIRVVSAAERPAAAASSSASRSSKYSMSGLRASVTPADITAETIIPPWYGERLDLDHAIYVCFANARTREQRERDRDDDAGRGRVTVHEPGDCDERFRHYLDHAPRSTGPVQVPIQV